MKMKINLERLKGKVNAFKAFSNTTYISKHTWIIIYLKLNVANASSNVTVYTCFQNFSTEFIKNRNKFSLARSHSWIKSCNQTETKG